MKVYKVWTHTKHYCTFNKIYLAYNSNAIIILFFKTEDIYILTNPQKSFFLFDLLNWKTGLFAREWDIKAVKSQMFKLY